MRRGFTLVELIVVILLIGVLATVVIAHIGEKPDWAKWRITRAEIARLKGEIELFKVDHNRYPEDLQELVARHVRDESPRDGWGREFVYRAPGVRGAPFDIVSWGSDGQPGGTGHAEDLWSHPSR